MRALQGGGCRVMLVGGAPDKGLLKQKNCFVFDRKWFLSFCCRWAKAPKKITLQKRIY
jgi:hypothetical protein